jgi:hypothetical protein
MMGALLFAAVRIFSAAPNPTPIDWPYVQPELFVTTPDFTVTCITHAGDGSARIFVASEKGRIWIVKDGVLLPKAFLDISASVISSFEQGLLSIAFAPDYSRSGEFYVFYSRKGERVNIVSRFKVGSDPNLADAASETILLQISPTAGDHNAGQMAFGPDGYLYIGIGDATRQIESQTTGTLFGKILRIDVSGGGPAYKVPPTNPFVGKSGYLPEIWAMGLRNPWRFSFDSLTGDLFITDVGNNVSEEINVQPRSSLGGENYGWPIFEGTVPYAGDPNPAGLTSPTLEYFHENPEGSTASSWPKVAIIGGMMSRQSPADQMYGIYFYADQGTGRIWGMKQVDGKWRHALVLNGVPTVSDILPPDFFYTTFGSDEAGNLYIARYTPSKPTAVFKLVEKAKCHEPFVAPTGVNYTEPFDATVGCVTPGAVVHYRLACCDAPTLDDPVVENGKFRIEPGHQTFTLRAFKEGLEPSEPVFGPIYNQRAGLTSIQFSPLPGPLETPTNLAISATAGTVVRYTLDGSVPDSESTIYTAPIAIVPGQTVTATAKKPGFQGVFKRGLYPEVAENLQIHLRQAAVGGWELFWQAKTTRTYTVQNSADLLNWSNAGEPLPGNDAEASWPVSTASPAFYRMLIK